jgi:predicted 2-oxoglutarate/Fe(II)-dependent dioxygenase YbiX/peroxiredoxin
MTGFVTLMPGDPAPWFKQRTFGNPKFAFDTVAGRYVVLCFHGGASDPHAQAAIAAATRSPCFDDQRASFFGVTRDPADEAEARIADRPPGLRHFLDFDGAVSRLYGALAREGDETRNLWVVLDPTLRVIGVAGFSPDRSDIAKVLDFVERLPPPERHAGVELQAPVLLLPNVLEPALCERLVALYEASGGEESGFMREVDGKTVAVHDHGHKRRRDHVIEDGELIKALQARFMRRVVPEIQKAHQFRVTRMERYIVACYAAEDGGHFRAHRDNTTPGTAHRRFAVSINLNADFEGGEVSFPEYGPRGFKPPPGGAVVFSCSLLHAVSKVTRGRRYAFLPFLYDDAAAQIRERNAGTLTTGSNYKASA